MDEDLENLFLRDLLFFLALRALKGWIGVVDKGAEVEAGLTLFRRIEGSGLLRETNCQGEAPELEPPSPDEDV